MRTVDLFAGCGGLSLGFQQAGFEIVAAFDNWQPAIDIYRDNFSHPMLDRMLPPIFIPTILTNSNLRSTFRQLFAPSGTFVELGGITQSRSNITIG